jgi:hypothetical protein
MPKTYEPIQTTTLGTAQLTVTLSSIPQTYTDLILIMNGHCFSDYVLIRVNGDTGSNYSRTYLQGNGSVASSTRLSNQGSLYSGLGSSSTNIGQAVNHFMNYSNTTTYKTVLNVGGFAASYIGTQVGLWRNTAAITSISITNGDSVNNIGAGTSFTLYGVKSA